MLRKLRPGPYACLPSVGRHIAGLALICGAITLNADTVCTMNDLSRTISIIYDQPGQPVPCEVRYEKPSEHNRSQAQRLWRADNEAGYCEAKAAEFVGKLQDLGWTCRAQPAPMAAEGPQ